MTGEPVHTALVEMVPGLLFLSELMPITEIAKWPLCFISQYKRDLCYQSTHNRELRRFPQMYHMTLPQIDTLHCQQRNGRIQVTL